MNYEPLRMGNQPQQGLKAVVNGRPMFASVDIQLDQGEKVLADAGAMTWMDEGIAIETEIKDGCFAGLARTCSGESCCLNTFQGPGKVGFAFDIPGDMVALAVDPTFGWILARGAFVCGSPDIKVSARFAGCCACLAADEGPFLTRVTSQTNGVFYAGAFGSIVRHDLAPGQILVVEHGLFFAANDKTKLKVGLVGGVKATCCSGEGLVMKFFGPCTIFTQSRDPNLFYPPEPQPGVGTLAVVAMNN